MRADGYGMRSAIVDGFDAIAVYDAVAEAVGVARGGGGPTFVECKTYRVRGHFIGDPERYRTKDEVEAYKSDDPIVRASAHRRTLRCPKKHTSACGRRRAKNSPTRLAFARASAAPDPAEAFVGAYAGDRDATPLGALAARETAEFFGERRA